MISVNGLTKKFPNGKGLFDLTFDVQKGEVFGYIGPNGAGKSTTIRHLMGFMKANRGTVAINGRDAWADAPELKRQIGYLPGEMAFMEGMNGQQFLALIGNMQGMKDKAFRDELIDRFQFDVKTPIRKMSKGMKQKVGIVAAFMHDPDILILDEPTSGLDPLMQKLFIDLVLEEKQKGKTILMSSHSFQEIERTCDRAGIIKDGVLVAVKDISHLRRVQRRIFDVRVKEETDINQIIKSDLDVQNTDHLNIQIVVQGNYRQVFQVLSGCNIDHMAIRSEELEDLFMNFYDRKEPVK
ncbi:ABC-2 type transport system ATP-binding protein [Scopulibacillus darangshiensis]|uniref:ABC-2 type transport system ATP-binding protein n=1 Tax=Scopulibacillus darangshiensis TaxID=442528 RepID=A0A4R2P7I4_9BACL|nr:ABC transporter ATP-binding protein [Scopulibacillus darangshiensis]TCP29785.1 ABC-2 type transport system ATP-binding protein [Scopulibacillus darangshiensis]